DPAGALDIRYRHRRIHGGGDVGLPGSRREKRRRQEGEVADPFGARRRLTQCGHPCCERSTGLPSGSQTRDSASRLGGLFLTSVAAPHCLHTGTRASTLSTSKPKWLIPSLS